MSDRDLENLQDKLAGVELQHKEMSDVLDQICELVAPGESTYEYLGQLVRMVDERIKNLEGTIHNQECSLEAYRIQEEQRQDPLFVSLDEFYEWGHSDGGKAVWSAWVAQMNGQGREVAEARQSWDTLPEQDKELDAMIAGHVAIDFMHWLRVKRQA